ncbi:HzsA-related protein [Kaarinaea lacus]
MNQIINSKLIRLNINRLCNFGGVSILGISLGFSLFMSGCGQSGDTDPLLGEFTFDVPVAYVKRPVDELVTFVDGDNGNANPRNAHQYKPGPTAEGGGNLYIREFVSNTAREYNLTANPSGGFPGTAPQYDVDGNLTREAGDVADPDVSYDGKKIVFAFRPGDPPNTDPDEQSKWDLWEFVFTVDDDENIVSVNQGTFQPVMPDTTTSQIGNDIDPTYLPDGRIVFSSDRVTKKAFTLREATGSEITEEPLMDESNREPAVNLHTIIPGDSASLKQISLNQSHELDPTLISTGKIVFSRWEHASRGEAGSPFPLFQVLPDGTEPDVLYGAHSFTDIDTGVAAFLQAREAQDGTLIATRMSRIGTYLGGDLVKIDYKNFVDVNTPRPNSTSNSADGHVSITNVSPLAGYAAEGRFATPFPLWDNTNRILVAWAYCEVQDQNGNRELCSLVDNPTDTNVYSPAPPGFGIWMMLADGVTMSPIVLPQEGWSITDPIAILDRITAGDYPNVPDDKQPGGELDQVLYDSEFGLLKISSVYDTDDLAGRGLTALRSPEVLTCVDPNNPIDSGTCTGTRTQVSINALQMSTPDERPVRFIRLVGPAFVIDGTNSQSIRENLGYHVVEPDGSVVMQAPAGRPFSIELVDKLGHRFRNHPQTWLQVQAGETLQCNGCHAGHTQTTALNQGAPGGFPFPGTDAGSPIPEMGETMAETLDRVSCADADGTGDVVDGVNGAGCLYQRLSGDIVYQNIWNSNSGNFAILYNTINLDLILVPPPPTGPLTVNAVQIPVMLGGFASQAVSTDPDQIDCIKSNGGQWVRNCRIAVNYETHIQTIWEKSRWLDPMNTGTMGNYPCVRCHREFNRDDSLDNPTMVDIPDGQLNLTRVGSHQVRNDSTLWESFLELTDGDDLQKLNANGDALEYVTEVVVDPNDPNNTIVQNVSVNRCTELPNIFPQINDLNKCGLGDAMDRNRGGNRNYGYFYSKMTSFDPNQDQIDHTGMLNSAELRMINEWIELGRRYWGDPFDQRANQ